MTTKTETPTETNAATNHETVIRDLRCRLRGYGRQEARGGAGRPAAALDLAECARNGEVDEDFAKTAYTDYAEGYAEVIKNNPLVYRQANPDHTSVTQQASKFRQFIKAGAQAGYDGPSVLRLAAEVAKQLSTTDARVKSAFDAMLDVARAQLKSPDRQLTRDDIAPLVVLPPKTEKTDLDKLIAAYKAAHKLRDELDTNKPLAIAVDNLRAAIVEAGGEVPALTKAEKEEAQAMKFLAANGLIAVVLDDGSESESEEAVSDIEDDSEK